MRYMRASAPWVMSSSEGGGGSCCCREIESVERGALKGAGRAEVVVIACVLRSDCDVRSFRNFES